MRTMVYYLSSIVILFVIVLFAGRGVSSNENDDSNNIDIIHKFYTTSNNLFQGDSHIDDGKETANDNHTASTRSSSISSQNNTEIKVRNKTTNYQNITKSNVTTGNITFRNVMINNGTKINKTQTQHIHQRTMPILQNASVISDVIVEQSNEPEECADEDDDDTSAEGKETKYVKGIEQIQSLTKDTSPSKSKNTTTTKKHGKTFTTDIDLKDIAKLFKGKDLTKFQKIYEEHIKNKSFETLRERLYDEKSRLKIFDEAFDDLLDQKTEKNLNKLVEETIKKEETSIRYKIHFPLFYHSVGTITLPFDDLVEPFEAWYAGELNMSRIDYYYGMDKSYQRGDIGEHGVVVKITPAHWGKKTDLDKTTSSCWFKEESKWTNRRAQTVVPMNIRKFKFSGEDHFNGVPTYKFIFQKSFVHKNNSYILHVTKTKPYKPLRYEMIGYDHLLRSHYDHYIIDYFMFEPWQFDYNILRIPKHYKCHEKLQKMKSHFEANPMWDFLHGEVPGHREQELNETYENYKTKHNKMYDSHIENHKRKDIFRHNSRFVHTHNRAQLNFTLELNHLSDLSEEEFEMMKGQPDVDTPEMQKELNDIPQLRLNIPEKPLPKSLDWRDYGVVGDVHSQSFCASCWAFSAVGAIETANAIQNGSLEELSVQELIDCSWPYNNNGCRGGWSWRALKFVGDYGIVTRKSYGKYLGQEGYCHCGKKDKCNTIKKISYRTIEKHDKEKLKLAIAMFGAGSVSVQCARKTFKFYSSGIYDDPKCGRKTDHAVVVVGYGVEKGIPFWIIKNSWGKLWGDNGYIKITMKEDLCGVLQNGALMVSLSNWKNVNEKHFLFENLHKTTTTSKTSQKDKIMRQYYEKDLPDFFSQPNHVTQYLEKQRRRK